MLERDEREKGPFSRNGQADSHLGRTPFFWLDDHQIGRKASPNISTYSEEDRSTSITSLLSGAS
jgi:hypothetical protein